MSAGVHVKTLAFCRKNAISSSRSVPMTFLPPSCCHLEQFGTYNMSAQRLGCPTPQAVGNFILKCNIEVIAPNAIRYGWPSIALYTEDRLTTKKMSVRLVVLEYVPRLVVTLPSETNADTIRDLHGGDYMAYVVITEANDVVFCVLLLPPSLLLLAIRWGLRRPGCDHVDHHGYDPIPRLGSLWSFPARSARVLSGIPNKLGEVAPLDELLDLPLKRLTIFYGVFERSMEITILCWISSLRFLK
ncbi:hypothetical protein Nepgr_032009 [Nepenthes gracilis]|uniref:Uncharacterized protein n=1 Tax=Nepenthes gracilis TaxID=150966 RepID=A0AAD3Y7Z4_NEPGR|nr:hypothetical protein Nepgr_032009 [Nepenthes gracilis]